MNLRFSSSFENGKLLTQVFLSSEYQRRERALALKRPDDRILFKPMKY